MINPDIQSVLDGESEGCIVCGDCLEIMKDMPDGCVDAVITDPPFGAGRDFANDDGEFFPQFCLAFANRLDAIGAANVLVEVGKNDEWMRAALDAIYKYRWAIILNYTNSMRQGAVGFSNFGLVLWYSRGGKCVTRYMDRIDAPLENTLGGFQHPSPKCVAHYQELCRMFTKPTDIILDPFCGSGTTCVAAKKLGRRWIGIDISEEYCRVARNRVQNTERPLFK